MDCSLPGSSVHGNFQARVLEWGAIAFSNGGEKTMAPDINELPELFCHSESYLSQRLDGIDSRTGNCPYGVETRSRVERQGLFCSLGVAIVCLPASPQLAPCILNKQE